MILDEFTSFTKTFISEKNKALKPIIFDIEDSEDEYSTEMASCYRNTQLPHCLKKIETISEEPIVEEDSNSINLEIVSNRSNRSFYDSSISDILKSYGQGVRIVFEEQN